MSPAGPAPMIPTWTLALSIMRTAERARSEQLLAEGISFFQANPKSYEAGSPVPGVQARSLRLNEKT